MRANSMATNAISACLLLTVMALPVPAFAAEPEQTQELPPTKPPQAEAVPQDKPRVTPSSTFTPSEQIKADSSVPFPVDI